MKGRTITTIKDITDDIAITRISTGEMLNRSGITVTEKNTMFIPEKEGFYYVYQSYVQASVDFTITSRKIFEWMAMNMSQDENEIRFAKSDQEECARFTKLTYNTVKNEVANMVKCDMIKRRFPSIYFVNPKFVWRGTRKNRYAACKTYKDMLSVKRKKRDIIEDFENQK